MLYDVRGDLLRSVGVVLDRLPDKDWDVGREMKGWRPALPPYDNDSGDEFSGE